MTALKNTDDISGNLAAFRLLAIPYVAYIMQHFFNNTAVSTKRDPFIDDIVYTSVITEKCMIKDEKNLNTPTLTHYLSPGEQRGS